MGIHLNCFSKGKCFYLYNHAKRMCYAVITFFMVFEQSSGAQTIAFLPHRLSEILVPLNW